MSDWDAQRYHRVSDPQMAWGRRIAERLAPVEGERILDLGCGTGRLTTEIVASAPGLSVVGLDLSQSMLGAANGRPVPYQRVRADGAALPFVESFDAVFSNATLHWIVDHEAVFCGVHRVLTPGGRFVAQCGGAGNLRVLRDRVQALMNGPRFAHRFTGWRDVKEYADVPATRARLARAGFERTEVWLEPAPTAFEGPAAFAEFISCVCLRRHVERLTPEEREVFIDDLTGRFAADDPSFTLDYRRLNIVARKPGLA